MRRFVPIIISGLLVACLLYGCSRKPADVSDVVPPSSTPTGAEGTPEAATPSDAGVDDEAIEGVAVSEQPSPSPGITPEATVQTVAPSGGGIRVDDPQSPIAGLSITVPAGAYPSETEFAISHRPFNVELPETVTPLTPIIAVDNGGIYAEEVMTVTVPIDLPESHFAMGFFLHEDGSLEGMPIIDLSSDSITIATMHFCEFFVGMIADALLVGAFDTGFRPGKDDWQFANDGSYIAPGGHCAGQSLTAMWYYVERASHGSPSLYGRYDNVGGAKTPAVWQDDVQAYRLASVVQHDIDWDNSLLRINRVLGAGSDALNWRAFLYAMLVTGEPQHVGIYNGKGGHAMIAYGANADTGTLYIVDPNFHGDRTRMILYSNESFSAYVSGSSKSSIARSGGQTYPIIRYFAKSALIPWGRIAARWSQLDSGSSWDDLFPPYEIEAIIPQEADDKAAAAAEAAVFNLLGLGTSEQPPLKMPATSDALILGETLKTTSSKIAFGAFSPADTHADEYVHFDVDVRFGNTWLEKDPDGFVSIPPGQSLLGLYVTAEGRYVGFEWITVENVAASTGILVEVQAHADIRRVNQPDEAAGYEGQTVDHDTPFEKIKIEGSGDAALVGQTHRVTWADVPNENQEGTRFGWIQLTLSEEGDEIVSFRARETLRLAGGTVQTSEVQGKAVPAAEGTTGQFLLVGEDVCGNLQRFVNVWEFGSGDTREVTGYGCDEYSVIRITIQ